MSWNDDEQRDPWKRGSGNQSPPDLDKIIQNVLGKLGGLFGFKPKLRPVGFHPSNQSAWGAVLTFFAIILTVWFLSGIFIVGPAEQSVVLRFGQYHETLGPGPHWIPRVIDQYAKVNVQRVNSFEFDADMLTMSSNDADKPKPVIPIDGMMDSTAKNDDSDKNLVHIELSVQYRIVDPNLYLYNIVNAPQTLNQVAESALSQVVGTMQLNDVLTKGRDALARLVTERLVTLMDQYQTGLEVVVANIRKAQAPEQVADAFMDVVQAGQDEQRYIQQAQAYASKVVPIAEGVQSRILADANAYQQQVVLSAKAHVANYNAIAAIYKKSPSITRERMYLDAMQSVLSRSSKIYIDGDAANNVLYLPLDKLAKQVSPAAARQGDASGLTNLGAATQSDDAARVRSSNTAGDWYSDMYQSYIDTNSGSMA